MIFYTPDDVAGIFTKHFTAAPQVAAESADPKKTTAFASAVDYVVGVSKDVWAAVKNAAVAVYSAIMHPIATIKLIWVGVKVMAKTLYWIVMHPIATIKIAFWTVVAFAVAIITLTAGAVVIAYFKAGKRFAGLKKSKPDAPRNRAVEAVAQAIRAREDFNSDDSVALEEALQAFTSTGSVAKLHAMYGKDFHLFLTDFTKSAAGNEAQHTPTIDTDVGEGFTIVQAPHMSTELDARQESYFEQRFGQVVQQTAFNPSWKNAEGNICAMIDDIEVTESTPVGTITKCVDDDGRWILIVGTGLGNVVVYQRFSEGFGTISFCAPEIFVTTGMIRGGERLSDEEIRKILAPDGTFALAVTQLATMSNNQD